MKLFKWLTNAWSPSPTTKLDDVDFGVIENLGEIWQGEEARFPPGLEPVGVTVKGDASGPSQGARVAFRELATRYDSLKPTIASQLQEEYLIANPGRADAHTDDILAAFKLVGISVGVERGKLLDDNEFVLTFESSWRSEMLIDIRIKNWIAVEAVGYD